MTARETYQAFAPHYDAYTAHHRYEEWTRTLEQLAQRAGLSGRRLLDVACGTGKSFLPFLARGYEVVACDLSPAMAALAAEKAAGRARVEVHDMRSLPRPGGVVVFDANTLRAYRTYFAAATVVQSPDRVLVWDGRTPDDLPAGGRACGELLALERDGEWWSRTRLEDRQRHHDEATVRRALIAAGLPWIVTYGMQLDGSVGDGFDELTNSKALYVARASAPERGERR
jgi:SAM-dependent methyltransferase